MDTQLPLNEDDKPVLLTGEPEGIIEKGKVEIQPSSLQVWDLR
jgi:hypothetical protein